MYCNGRTFLIDEHKFVQTNSGLNHNPQVTRKQRRQILVQHFLDGWKEDREKNPHS